MFCTKCGAEVAPGSSFCSACGTKVTDHQEKSNLFHYSRGLFQRTVNENDRRSMQTNNTQYAGNVYSCPCCGRPMPSFTATCPSCGYELRDARTAVSVRSFSSLYQEIEGKSMPPVQVRNSLMKSLIGIDFKDNDDVADAHRRFEKQKRSEKIALITNWAVPNTKEDLLEFMLIASANIHPKTDDLDDELFKAWKGKMEQVYHKAQIVLKQDADFAQIEEIYNGMAKKVRSRKRVKYGIPCVYLSVACLAISIVAESPLFLLGTIGTMIAGIIIVAAMK